MTRLRYETKKLFNQKFYNFLEKTKDIGWDWQNLRHNPSLPLQFVIDNHKLDINLANFGTFSFEDTPKRIGRNPKTLQKFEIKARKKIKFKPSNKIKKSIN